MAEYLSLTGLQHYDEKIKAWSDNNTKTKADKLTTAVSGQVLVDDGNGNLNGSGVTVGTEALAETPLSTVLATELAVSTAIANCSGGATSITDEEIDALFTESD